MKTLAERAWDKGKLRHPSPFIPNGCGPAAGGRVSAVLVPDELADVDYSPCCNTHDYAYHRGGFWGLFYRKPRADVGLGACMMKQFYAAAGARWKRGTWAGRAKGVGTAALGTVVGPVYTLAVLAFGWTPLTWPLRKRKAPSSYKLRKVAKALGRPSRSTRRRRPPGARPSR